MRSDSANFVNFAHNPLQDFTNLNHTETSRQTSVCIYACISNSEGTISHFN